jgi:hypothetical protein
MRVTYHARPESSRKFPGSSASRLDLRALLRSICELSGKIPNISGNLPPRRILPRVPPGELTAESGTPTNALAIPALVDRNGVRLYDRADAERLLGLKARSLLKRSDLVERDDGTFVAADWVDREREQKLALLGVADMPQGILDEREALSERVAHLEGEVQRSLSEIRRLIVVVDSFRDLYQGRLPIGTVND